MTDTADATAFAYNAEAAIGPPADDNPLLRLQLAELEAREHVDRLKGKLAKFEGHVESIRESLADAETAAAAAADELDAFPGETDEVDG